MNLVSTTTIHVHQHLRPALRVQCAWCGEEMETTSEGAATTRVSHGICPPCALRYFNLEMVVNDPR